MPGLGGHDLKAIQGVYGWQFAWDKACFMILVDWDLNRLNSPLDIQTRVEHVPKPHGFCVCM